ncbi:MAG: lytic murein transglycosylase [Acidimicrobiales bacterium]
MPSTSPLPATLRSRVVTALAAAAGLLALVGLVAPPVDAASAAAPPAAPDTTVATISPDLALVAVDSAPYRTARAALERSETDLAAARSDRETSSSLLMNLRARDEELSGRITQDTTAQATAAAQLEAVRRTLRAIAVTSYVQGHETPVDLQDLDAAFETENQAVVFNAVSAGQRAKEQAANDALAAAAQALDTDVAERAEVRDQARTTTTARDDAVTREGALGTEIAQEVIAVETTRARAGVVKGDGMSLIALDAYWKAAQETARSNPGCGIEWWALAGIGRAEGHHGTFGTSQVLGNGDTSLPIVGVILDGSNDTTAISDSDDGEVDGDPDHDHAVGPMQFIPSTWKRWKADGNGDGNANPNNMYDAALAAAHYLCAGGPMRTDEDLTRGYYSYNRSDEYGAAVLSSALAYRDGIPIPAPPPAPLLPAVPSGG